MRARHLMVRIAVISKRNPEAPVLKAFERQWRPQANWVN
jgi:hypothetical protein